MTTKREICSRIAELTERCDALERRVSLVEDEVISVDYYDDAESEFADPTDDEEHGTIEVNLSSSDAQVVGLVEEEESCDPD